MNKQTTNDSTGWYANVFKAWQVKQLGNKPTAAMLATVHGLGLRPGKQALANAMALRGEGVSGAQIVMACGAPQLNRMRGLIADGLLRREATPPNGLGHTVYKLHLTAKGEADIKRRSEALARAVNNGGKAKGKAKAKVTVKAPRKPRTAKLDVVPVQAPAPQPEPVAARSDDGGPQT